MLKVWTATTEELLEKETNPKTQPWTSMILKQIKSLTIMQKKIKYFSGGKETYTNVLYIISSIS